MIILLARNDQHVIERQLLVFPDIALRKYTHAHGVTDSPFGDVAIRIATVIGEPSDTTILGGVNELRKT